MPGVFQNNIIFITVSQSPNLKGILETMWKKIVRKKKPEFQNVEDAHRQLQQQLLRQDKPTLVVLDDVWSRTDLEKVLFEGEGYKTLVTTRDCSTIPKTHCTELYQLPLLDDADALSLFCFWAFRQRSIPCTAAENLVKQVYLWQYSNAIDMHYIIVLSLVWIWFILLIEIYTITWYVFNYKLLLEWHIPKIIFRVAYP